MALSTCYRLNVFVPLPKFIYWCPTPNVTIFGDGVFMEVMKVKEGHQGGALIPDRIPDRIHVLETWESLLLLSLLYEDGVKRQPSTNQKKKPQSELTFFLMAAWANYDTVLNISDVEWPWEMGSYRRRMYNRELGLGKGEKGKQWIRERLLQKVFFESPLSRFTHTPKLHLYFNLIYSQYSSQLGLSET